MSPVRGACSLVVCLATGAACSGTDELLPDPVDAAVDAEVDAEEPPPPPPVQPDYRHTYHAIQMLVALEARLSSLLVNGQFPVGQEPLTPGHACCQTGGVTVCQPNPAAWNGALWQALQFRIDVAHGYVFGASSVGGTSLTILARADLDCDGTVADIVMTCSLPGGVVRCDVEFPDVFE